ncbi:hypothetical protein GX50_02520 [[Emmonsia] crescens]|uniref:Uncharacterized protein n=1 Tax=[Emmonsia] crescens TaxID=73230 RepID=A0A2B7ZMV2_9EURO|nr:hypothetical protein GX50_02520 [Emmonsia crescens]
MDNQVYLYGNQGSGLGSFDNFPYVDLIDETVDRKAEAACMISPTFVQPPKALGYPCDKAIRLGSISVQLV